ncbi:MAG: histidine kinase [Bacteroidota bacterium]
MREILQQILSKFGNKVEERYEAEFQEKLYLNNLERAYLIGAMGVISFFLLTLADFLSHKDQETWERVMSGVVFIAHATICFGLIPTFFIQSKEQRGGFFKIIYSNRKLLFFITLTVLGASLLPLAISSFSERQSVIVFAIFIIIVNLGFKLPQRINIIVNVISIVLVTLGIIYVSRHDNISNVAPYLFECWALSLAVFIIASYQFQTEIVQFNYEKVLVEKNKLIQVQMETEFNHKLAEIEMTALRAQMNPHFLFNVLNSIKLYMIQNDARTASRYLTKFSRLIRLILNNSKSSMISLEEELNALKLYIEMENFRFNDKFDYNILVDESIPIDSVKIPPMIMQPYVENAIWHGLMHKEDARGLLLINIQKSESDGGLYFIIEDNGIGRERAMQIKTRTANKHKSVGMQITKDRIAIANKLFNTNASIEIVDLKDNAKSTGTRVVVHLPSQETVE